MVITATLLMEVSRFKTFSLFILKTTAGKMAIAHNGNLTNAAKLRHQLEEEGSIFHSSSDTEVFMHLLAKSKEGDMTDRILSVCQSHGSLQSSYFK